MGKRNSPRQYVAKKPFGRVVFTGAVVAATAYGGSVWYGANGEADQIGERLGSDGRSGAEAAAPVVADAAGGAVDVTKGGLDGVTEGESIDLQSPVTRDGDSTNEGGTDSSDNSIFSDSTIVAESGDGWIDAFQREGYTFNQISECADALGGFSVLETVNLVPGENPNPCA